MAGGKKITTTRNGGQGRPIDEVSRAESTPCGGCAALTLTRSASDGSPSSSDFFRYWWSWAVLKNLCSSSLAAEGRSAGSLVRQSLTTSLMPLLNFRSGFSDSSEGGSCWRIIMKT